MVQEQMEDAKGRMQKALESLRQELGSVRTGRASAGLVEHLRVDYYGTPTPLNQLATISTPDARLIVIQPYDRGAMGAIEKSILKSDLGLTPSNARSAIRAWPPPTGGGPPARAGEARAEAGRKGARLGPQRPSGHSRPHAQAGA